ncbi:MAG: oxidoreductase, partial [Pseudomonadota bacterium]
EFVGPVGRGTLHPHAYDKAVMTRLWEVSEKATGFTWAL